MNFKLVFSEKWYGFDDGYISSSSVFNLHNTELKLNTLEHKFNDFGIVKLLNDHEVLLITDRFNTIPIYFAKINKTITITDSLPQILNVFHWEFDKDIAIEHLLFDFTFTPFKTLYQGIYKVPAGTTAKVSVDGSFNIIEQLTNSIPESAAIYSKSSFEDKTLYVKQRILDYIAPSDSYYIPVSGGLDSRIVLGVASKYTDADIFSRTYGERNSLDVLNGRRIAKILGIRHEIVNKPDGVALAEFERTVIESGGELNGVHGHDLAGRDKFEAGPWRAKISGFIGDLLARGTNLKDNIQNKDNALARFKQSRSNFNSYNYNELLNASLVNSRNFINDLINDHLERIYEKYGNFESLSWDYYVTKRVGCMTSLLEYSTHISKPNYKPFLIPEIINFIASNAGNDRWLGMGYSKFAKVLIPELMHVPLSSNSIFTSKASMVKYRIEKRLIGKRNQILSSISNGNYIPLAHNATLNWRAILRRNPMWVKVHIKNACNTFDLNIRYLEQIFEEHCNGKKAHEEFLLRVISLGIISNSL